MAARPIKNVLVLGATGNTAPAIIQSLASHPAHFTVNATTRDKSKVTLPTGLHNVIIYETDYSPASLSSIFRNIDAIVSPLPAGLAERQRELIDLAIEAGVQRFLPSEFGVDSNHPNIETVLPYINKKTQIIKYLKAKEDKISWTSIIVGSYFDWTFANPRWMGWDVPNGKATIFDGGDVEFEATNVPQIGRAIAAALSPEHVNETANQYVYINSFTLTQNKVLAVLEKVTGQKLEVKRTTVEQLYTENQEKLRESPDDGFARMMLVQACLYGKGGVNNFSSYDDGRGLWNKRLGLPQEDLEESLSGILSRA